MKTKLTLTLFILFAHITFAQKATIKGVIKDINGKAIDNVSISYENTGTATDKKGNYSIDITAKEKIKAMNPLPYSYFSFCLLPI